MESNKSESKLMKFTKKELIDIITRKDDVEIRLKGEIKEKDAKISENEEVIAKNEQTINELQAGMDNVVSERTMLARKCTRLRHVIIWITLGFTFALVLVATL